MRQSSIFAIVVYLHSFLLLCFQPAVYAQQYWEVEDNTTLNSTPRPAYQWENPASSAPSSLTGYSWTNPTPDTSGVTIRSWQTNSNAKTQKELVMSEKSFGQTQLGGLPIPGSDNVTVQARPDPNTGVVPVDEHGNPVTYSISAEGMMGKDYRAGTVTSHGGTHLYNSANPVLAMETAKTDQELNNKTEDSYTSESWRALKGPNHSFEANKSLPDLHNDDALWGTTDATLADVRDPNGDGMGFLSGCTTITKQIPPPGGAGSEHKSCLRFQNPENNGCRVVRSIDRVMDMIGLTADGASVSTCGRANCIRVEFTSDGPNNASCAVQSKSSLVGFNDLSIIDKVTLSSVLMDDDGRLDISSPTPSISDPTSYQNIFTGGYTAHSTRDDLVYDQNGVITQSTNQSSCGTGVWERGYITQNIDFTQQFKQFHQSYGTVQFNYSSYIYQAGAAKYQVEFDLTIDPLDQHTLIQDPPGCVEGTREGGNCSASSWTCNVNELYLPDYTPSGLPEMFPGETPLLTSGNQTEMACMEAVANDYSCSPIPEGQTHCFDPNDPATCFTSETFQTQDSCSTLQSSSCGFVRSECMSRDANSGECYVFKDVYNCPTGTTSFRQERIETCERLETVPGGQCRVMRDVILPNIAELPITNDYFTNWRGCGPACLQLTWDRPGDNNFAQGQYFLHETFSLEKIEQAAGATLIGVTSPNQTVRWDDEFVSGLFVPGTTPDTMNSSNSIVYYNTHQNSERFLINNDDGAVPIKEHKNDYALNISEIDMLPDILRLTSDDRAKPITYAMSLNVGGRGELSYHIQFHFDPNDPIFDERIYEDPPGCRASLEPGGFCTADSFSCETSEVLPMSFGNTRLPLPDQFAPMYPNEPVNGTSICIDAVAQNYKCNPTGGPICSNPSDPNTCHEWDAWVQSNASAGACNSLQGDSSCSYLSSACDPAFRDPNTNECFKWIDTYDCSTETSTGQMMTIEEDVCTGQIQCISGDCVLAEPEESQAFGAALGETQIMNYIENNSDCKQTDENGNEVMQSLNTCVVMEGERGSCRVGELAGVIDTFDCCQSPEATTAGDYFKMGALTAATHWGTMRTEAYAVEAGWLQSGPYTTMVTDAFYSVARPVTDTLFSIHSSLFGPQGALTGPMEGITGAVSTVWDYTGGLLVDGVEAIYTTVVEAGKAVALAMEKVVFGTAEETGKKVAGNLASTGTQAAATEGASQGIMSSMQAGVNSAVQAGLKATSEALADTFAKDLIKQEGGKYIINPAIMGPLSAIMLAYTAYQLTMLAIQILYACEEEELELSQKKYRQACTFLYTESHGDEALGIAPYDEHHYCCYDSALPRIINEGAQSQFGRDQRGCYGFSIDELKSIDWEQIDFSEWEAIMMDSGLLPEYGDYGLETVAKRNQPLGNLEEDEMQNVKERTADRMDGICADVIRQGLESEKLGRVNYTIDYDCTHEPLYQNETPTAPPETSP